MRACSSWMLRVGRIIQPWSRKYFRSSPRIVGPAYDMKSFPVLTSYAVSRLGQRKCGDLAEVVEWHATRDRYFVACACA